MKVERRVTKGDITKIILDIVKTSGVIASGLVLPNSLTMMKKLGIINYQSKKQSITVARGRLLKAGFLKKNKKGFLSITKQGEEKLKKIELANYTLITPKIWDKKWRMLIFDIPESKKSLRDKIRITLQTIGFKRLQDSVWVFPYDCSELISLLKADFKVGRDLLYLIVDEIENDPHIKTYFNL